MCLYMSPEKIVSEPLIFQCDEGWTLINDKYCVITSKNSEKMKITWTESLSWCGLDGGVNLELENDEIEASLRKYIEDELREEDNFKVFGGRFLELIFSLAFLKIIIL